MTVDLGERLRQVLGSGPRAARVPRLMSPGSERVTLDVHDLLDGREVQNAKGSCFLVERTFELEYLHGGAPLGSFLGLGDLAMACLARDGSTRAALPRDVLFLDTETTGLSGGTGTFVFLVGLGFFHDERFVVRQYFMRHHAEEPAMLAELAPIFAEHPTIVTFNGKAFDVPLIRTRFVANRLRSALSPDRHLDLLFPARRLWRERLESCSLGSLEQAILGHVRVQDVPSWVIPELYFRYLRGGDARPMSRVFDHNLDDILSLVALAVRIGRSVADAHGAQDDAREKVAIARLKEDLGFVDEAYAGYEAALKLEQPREARMEIAVRLAGLCKRTGRAARAVEVWSRLIRARCPTFTPYLELAKHYEHRDRDYKAAIGVVDEALGVMEIRGALGRAVDGSDQAALEYRLARLLRKQSRLSISANRQAESGPPLSG